MRLLLDLGNSRLKWACADAAAAPWRASGSFAWTGDVAAQLQRAWSGLAAPQAVLAASVVDAAREAVVTRAVAVGFDRTPQWLRTPAEACGVRNGYLEPSRLGVDRFLSMVAAFAAGHAPCVVASLGTALTLDALAADGRHLGGWIVPGLHAMTDAIVGSTTLVGAVEAGTLVDLPRDTADAVATGCHHALAAVIERFVARTTVALGAPPRLLVTGGDAAAVLPQLTLPAQRMDESVLRGLAHWALTHERPACGVDRT